MRFAVRSRTRADGAGLGWFPATRARLLLSALVGTVLVIVPLGFTQSAGAKPLASHTAAAPAKGSISWSVAPAGPKGYDGRKEFSYKNIKPGSVISDHVVVTNHSRFSVRFSIYATDAVTSAKGGIGLLPAATKPTDVGAWSTFTARQVTIKAGQHVIDPFTIRVPATVTPGDHTGGVVASVTESATNRAGQPLAVDQRLAVPIALGVAGALTPALTVESITVGYHGTANPFGSGTAAVSYTVHNTGNVRLTGPVAVSVSGLSGTTVAAGTPTLPTMLPGGALRFSVQVPGVYPAGSLTAHVRVLVRVPTGATPVPLAAKPVASQASLFAMPWALLVLVILVIAAIVAAFWLRRHQRRRTALAIRTATERGRAEGAAGANPRSSMGRHAGPTNDPVTE